MQSLRKPAVTLLAVLSIASPTALSAQETPVPVIATVPFAGITIGDICFDPIANLVYVVDLSNNATHVYSSTLAYLGVNPGAFPVTATVAGVTSEPTIGGVIWVVRDNSTGVESLYAAVNIAAVPFFVANIASAPGSSSFGVDAPAGLTNALVLNDIVNIATAGFDYLGAQILAPVPNPGGVSLGVAHVIGPFVANATFPPTGAMGIWFMNILTGLPVDTVGVLTSPTGTQSPGFDFGPLTAAGASTIFIGDGAANTISLSTFQRTFFRGDANSDALVNIADVLFTLNFLLVVGSAPPTCLDAADVSDDGVVNIADPLALAGFLFAGGAPPPAPFGFCGFDPTPDANRCAVSATICP